MKLNNDPFSANMNTVEHDGKKVLVWPFQAELTKGKEVDIGEERQPRMMRPKNLEIGRWKKNERSKPQFHPKSTFYILMTKYRDAKVGMGGSQKLDHTVSQTGPSSFNGLGQYFCSRELIQQMIPDSTTIKFRRMGSSLAR
jgi:hypothetical protein